MKHRNKLQRYYIGAFAGAIASVFHTLVMLALHRFLPHARRDPVPPKQIAVAIAEKTGTESAVTGARLNVVTAVGHFGYGAVAGALYAPLAERTRRKPLVAGISFGVGVWAASYLGWIPALNLLTPATRHPAQRNVMMILAHIAWGTALAMVVENSERKRQR